MTTLTPRATAVVIIDVQVGVFETDPPPLDKAGVLARINQVTGVGRAAGALVIFLQHDSDPKDQWLIPLTDAWKLHPALQIGRDDCVIRKTACDGFYRTDLDDYLRSHAVRTVVVAGYATDFCVDTTIRSAASREFNRFLGLEKGASESGLLVSLPPSPQYTNHLGSVHASALLAVAEAGSAEFLLRHFGDVAGYVPVVRRLEAKFRKSARGRVSARASVEGDALNRLSGELQTKGRALIGVSVEVVDEGGMVVLSGVVEWFIARAVAERPG